jgi:hypothetical protein
LHDKSFVWRGTNNPGRVLPVTDKPARLRQGRHANDHVFSDQIARPGFREHRFAGISNPVNKDTNAVAQ